MRGPRASAHRDSRCTLSLQRTRSPGPSQRRCRRAANTPRRPRPLAVGSRELRGCPRRGPTTPAIARAMARAAASWAVGVEETMRRCLRRTHSRQGRSVRRGARLAAPRERVAPAKRNLSVHSLVMTRASSQSFPSEYQEPLKAKSNMPPHTLCPTLSVQIQHRHDPLSYTAPFVSLGTPSPSLPLSLPTY